MMVIHRVNTPTDEAFGMVQNKVYAFLSSSGNLPKSVNLGAEENEPPRIFRRHL